MFIYTFLKKRIQFTGSHSSQLSVSQVKVLNNSPPLDQLCVIIHIINIVLLFFLIFRLERNKIFVLRQFLTCQPIKILCPLYERFWQPRSIKCNAVYLLALGSSTGRLFFLNKSLIIFYHLYKWV